MIIIFGKEGFLMKFYWALVFTVTALFVSFPVHTQTCTPISKPSYASDAGNKWLRFHKKSLALMRQSKREEALEVGRKALKIAEENSGPVHPSVAWSLNQLSRVHMRTGGYADQAEPLLLRSFRIFEAAYGEDSTQVADTLFLLSDYYSIKMDDEKRIARHLQAMAIYEKNLNPEGINFANIYSNHGVFLSMSGDHKNALKFHQKSLAINERCFGQHHKFVAKNLSGIARALSALRDYAGAEASLKRAIDIAENTDGKNSAELADYLNELAWVFRGSGRIEEAKQLDARVSEINIRRKQ
jgi:tetratricopeptide (TPR) repeat protein